MSAEQAKEEAPGQPDKASPPSNEVTKKASRTQMTPLQKEVLEASYTLNPFPPAEHKRSLGERIGLDEKQISTWFSGRRRKDKKTEDSSAGPASASHPPQDTAPPAPAAPAPAPAAASPLQQSHPSIPHQASPAAPPYHIQQTSVPPGAAPTPPSGPPVQMTSAQQPGAQHPSAPTPGAAPAGAGTAAVLPGLGTLPGTALPSTSLPGLPGLSVSGLPAGGVLQQLQPPAQGLAQLAPGSLLQQQQQQLIQLLQQQPHLLQQQPQLLQAVTHPHLLQQMLIQQHQQQQQQQQQQRPGLVQSAGLVGLPGLVPMYPQQQPRPTLPPGAQVLSGLPGLGLPVGSHLHLQQQQQHHQGGTGLEGLPAEALRALQEAAKATLPQPYREDGPPLGWDFDDLPQAAIKAGVGGKHRRSEPISSVGPAFKAPRTADQSGVVHRGIPPLSGADKSRLRAEEKEQKRLDAIKERERKKEEKKKEMEDKKREREMARANERQEKLLSKGKGVQVAGPPDDLDLEWSRLVEEQQRSVGATPATVPNPLAPGGVQLVSQQQQQPVKLPPPERPEFPPASLNLAPAFAPEVGMEVGTEVLMVAAFLNSFSDVLGMAPPPSADQIAQAVHDGQDSLLLGAIHISMLRLVQADMEEAHASGAASVSAAGPGSAGHHFDRAMISAAHMLEGCWGWGYDMDSWRAHLNALTWPEVLRQLAVVGTSGSPRQKQGRGRRPSNVHKVKMGVEGEDVVEDEHGNLKLRLPNRLGIGTVKAASWQVLAEVGPEGLPIAEMAHRIHESGLRDFKYTKQPEATVAGALARDVLFTRVGPAQYALSSIIKHKLNAAPAQDGAGQEGKTEGMDVDEQDGQRANQHQGAPEGTEEGDSGGEDDDDEGGGNEDRGGTGEGGRPGASQPKAPWVGILAASDYDALNVGERLAALAWLIHTVCDSPSVRLLLDARVDQAINDIKEIVEMGKEIKRKRLEDAYAKSRAAADMASKKMAELQAVGGSLPGYPPPAAMPLNFDPQVAGAASAAAQRAMEDAAVAARLVSEVAKDDSEEEKHAQQRRMDALARVDEETAIQLQPLGLDRRYNRYWRVAPVGCDSGEVALGAQDPGIGRVFVEAADGSSWQLIQQPEQLDGLAAALDPRGAREGGLAATLHRLGPSLKRAMPSSPLTIDLRGGSPCGPSCPGAGPLQQQQQQHLARQLRVVRPQATLFPASAEVKPPVGEPVRPSKLKEDVLRIGAALPDSALHFDFDRAAWQQAVQQASTPLALRQCVGRLEASVVPDYLSAAYNRNPQILKGAWSSAQRQQQEAEAAAATSAEGAPSEADQQLAMEEPLSWLPPTYAAVALRLQALDAALYFAPQTRCGRDRLAGYRYILRPAPVARPTALEQLRQQIQQQQPQQQQQQQQQQQGEGIAPRCDILSIGVVPLAYGGTLTAHGRLKPALFFPELPLAFMAQSQQPMQLPIEQLRAAVAEAATAGTLMPPTNASTANGAAAAAAAAGEGRGGRSASAAHDTIEAQKRARKDAMVRASAAVRSLASRVASARGSSKNDKFAKARSHKAKKVRQSNLSKQLAREKGGIGSEDEGPDYGEGYDDGFDEQMEAMLGQGGEDANGVY